MNFVLDIALASLKRRHVFAIDQPRDADVGWGTAAPHRRRYETHQPLNYWHGAGQVARLVKERRI